MNFLKIKKKYSFFQKADFHSSKRRVFILPKDGFSFFQKTNFHSSKRRIFILPNLLNPLSGILVIHILIKFLRIPVRKTTPAKITPPHGSFCMISTPHSNRIVRLTKVMPININSLINVDLFTLKI